MCETCLAPTLRRNRFCSPTCKALAWNRANPERKAEAQRARRRAHPEKARAERTAWKRANPEKARAARSRRRARERAAVVERFTSAQVFERDSWRCQLCRRPVDRAAVVPAPAAATLDHVVPLALGGEHSLANVQCAHFLCNAHKGAGVLRPEQLRLIG